MPRRLSSDYSAAMVSEDGCLMDAGTVVSQHPVYRTAAVEGRVFIPLTPEQAALAEEIIKHGIGSIRILLRSALGQLGIDGFHPDVTVIRMAGQGLEVETLVTHLDGPNSREAMMALTTLVGAPTKPPIGRAALLPDASLRNKREVRRLIRDEELCVAEAAQVGDRGELLLPVEPVRYTFGPKVRELATIVDMLRGSARGVLKEHRTEHPLPDMLKSREFLVAGVHVDTPYNHVILDRVVQVGGEVSDIVHTEAVGLIAGRTVLGAGNRQVELWNANGRPVKVKDMQVVGRVYAPSVIELPGV